MSDPHSPRGATRWIPVASLALAVSMAAGIVATHPWAGHGNPADALRTTIRATGMLSAILFAVALFVRAPRPRLDLHRGVLASHVVHGIALAVSGLLWSATRLGDVARQSHTVFALFPDWTPMVLGSVGYAALVVLARGPERQPAALRVAAEAWLFTLFASFYADALISHASEGPAAWLLYGGLLGLLVAGAASRARRLRIDGLALTPTPAAGA